MLNSVWAARDHGGSDEKQNQQWRAEHYARGMNVFIHSEQKSKDETESQYIGKMFDVDLSPIGFFFRHPC